MRREHKEGEERVPAAATALSMYSFNLVKLAVVGQLAFV